MTTPPRHRIVVILLPTQEAQAQRSLLNAAAVIASSHHCALDIAALPSTARTHATPVPALPAPATWWDIVHEGFHQASIESSVELAAQALNSQEFAPTEPRLVLLPPGPEGIEVAARLAWRFGGAALGQCVALEMDHAGLVGQRAGYGGRTLLTLRTGQAQCFATLRSEVRPAPGVSPVVPARRTLSRSVALPQAGEVTPIEQTDPLPALEGAQLVVSGGRGMQGEEGFGLLRDIAQRLGGALGGSLPTVDAGWIPVARQIGQSGKFVSPRIYLAVGMSGTPQHMAGISSETTIIAINKDPEAPIFGIAEAGVVGDWRVLLPALLDRLNSIGKAPV